MKHGKGDNQTAQDRLPSAVVIRLCCNLFLHGFVSILRNLAHRAHPPAADHVLAHATTVPASYAVAESVSIVRFSIVPFRFKATFKAVVGGPSKYRGTEAQRHRGTEDAESCFPRLLCDPCASVFRDYSNRTWRRKGSTTLDRLLASRLSIFNMS